MKILFLALLSAASVLHAAEKPNVLFIMADDLRDYGGAYTRELVKTPNLDRLAQSGVVFTRASTAYALCDPSRTALLTGLRPSTTRVIGNGTDWREAVPADRLSPRPGRSHDGPG